MSDYEEHADDQRPKHPTSLELTEPPAAEVDAGSAIVLKISVSCPHGCDLRGQVINVVAADGGVVAASPPLDLNDDNAYETAEFSFTAPDDVGDHSWTLVCPRHETEHVVHDEGSLPISVRTLPHDTSLAVWNVPSPIVVNDPFRVHVGATCTSGCNLAGKEIEICDETGASLARGTLGETPWEGTRALYWTEVDLVAPGSEGSAARSITFAPTALPLAHDRTSARFGFQTVRPAECVVTVKVVQKDAGTPVGGAHVRLGLYGGYSDESGLAKIAVPKGAYELDVLKSEYEPASRVLNVNGDVSTEIDVAVIPPKNVGERWLHKSML